MPNHYTTMAICSPGHEFDVAGFVEQHAESCFCSIVKPMPEHIEYDESTKLLKDN